MTYTLKGSRRVTPTVGESVAVFQKKGGPKLAEADFYSLKLNDSQVNSIYKAPGVNLVLYESCHENNQHKGSRSRTAKIR